MILHWRFVHDSYSEDLRINVSELGSQAVVCCIRKMAKSKNADRNHVHIP